MVFLDTMFRRTNPDLRKAHRNLIELFGYFANANDAIQASGKATEEEKKYSNDLMIEAEEKLQTGVEQQALPILEQLCKEQTDFRSDYDLTMAFFRFISHQYLRTKALRELAGEELKDSLLGRDFGHLKHLVCHCAAENFGMSLFVDRDKFEILFLRSPSNCEFITGDQPIVNLFRAHDEETPPTELALYYPLKPHLSMILVPKEWGLRSVKVPPIIVDGLNNLIAHKSGEFLVAKEMESLQRTNDRLQEVQHERACVLLDRIREVAALADNCEENMAR